MKCIHKVQSGKTFLSSSIPSDWKSSHGQVVLRADKTHNLASAYSSINVFHIWQVHNKACSVWMRPIWYCGPYPWTLWRGRHLTQHQRLARKTEKGEREEWGGKLLDISQHETRGQIQHHHHHLTKSPLDSEWANYDIMWMMTLFCCPSKLVRVTPNLKNTLKQLFVCYFDFLSALACCQEHTCWAMWHWKES